MQLILSGDKNERKFSVVLQCKHIRREVPTRRKCDSIIRLLCFSIFYLSRSGRYLNLENGGSCDECLKGIIKTEIGNGICEGCPGNHQTTVSTGSNNLNDCGKYTHFD